MSTVSFLSFCASRSSVTFSSASSSMGAQRHLQAPPISIPPSLLTVFLLLLLLAAQTSSQRVTDYVYGLCNTTPYQSNSTFARNLNTVISTLTQRANSGYKYYLTQQIDSSDNSSSVYGAFQCRGDISTDDCSSCLGAIIAASYCGPAIGLRIQLLGCYLRYEQSDFTNFELGIIASNCSSQRNTTSLYQTNLATAIDQTVTSAVANQSNNYFAAVTVGSSHAIAQCLDYLSPSDCATCLNQSSSRTSVCNTSSSGFFYYVSCYYRFSDTNLVFNSSSSPTSPSISSPPPAPAPGSLLPGSAPSLSPVGQNISSPSPSSGSKTSSLSGAAIAGISVGLALAVGLVFCAVCFSKRHRSVKRDVAGGVSDPPSKTPPNFTIQELRTATGNFDARNKIGQGGFGIVYKGTLRSGKEVAIKTISPGENRGKEIDFMNEAKLITTVQHRNLIQLLGCATDDSKWYLVYEYLPNRSLDLHLFGTKDKFQALALDWKTRFNIISCIARGLCYLHEDSHVRIVHRDIKAANILLDGNLEPKIADFGLARLFAEDVSHLTTAVAGTLGYMPPEYAMGGQLSEKVDVYSFGMVALEIISGRRVIQINPVDGSQTHVLEWAWDLYENKKVVEMVDRRIIATANQLEVTRAVHVALLCTQAKPQTRPAMSQVYMMLCSQSAILELPTRPGIMSMGIFSGSSNQSQASSSSATGSGVQGAAYQGRRPTMAWTSGTTEASVNTASSGASEEIVGKNGNIQNMQWKYWSETSGKSLESEESAMLDKTDAAITELQAR